MSLTQKTTTTSITATTTTTGPDDVDLTRLFPATTVRSQIYRHETNLPRISVEHAAVIGTTSAIFFKNFLAKLSDRSIIKAAHIQQVVMDNPAFTFLQQPLEEEGGMRELVQKENRHWMEYKPKRKREGASIAGAKKVAKSVVDDIKAAGGGNDSKLSTDPIIADDDDYD